MAFRIPQYVFDAILAVHERISFCRRFVVAIEDIQAEDSEYPDYLCGCGCGCEPDQCRQLTDESEA